MTTEAKRTPPAGTRGVQGTNRSSYPKGTASDPARAAGPEAAPDLLACCVGEGLSWASKTTTLTRLLNKARNAAETENKGTHGGILGGRLLKSPGPRRSHNIAERTFLTLDFDEEVGSWTPAGFPWRSVGYDTHSSRPDAPRFRVVAAFDRPVQPDEWGRVIRALAERLAVQVPDVDESCLKWNQLAFLPERRPGVELRTWDNSSRPPLVVDELLNEGEALGVGAPSSRDGSALRDPFTLNGLVGAFNRVYDDFDSLIETFGLPYRREGSRWRHTDSSREAGVVELRPGWWYSHHSNVDPAAGHAHTAYDLVRIHKFGAHDGERPAPDWEPGASHDAMDAFALSDPRVKKEDETYMPESDFTVYGDDNTPDGTADDGTKQPPASPQAPGGKRQPPLSVLMRRFVVANFDVFPAGDDGRVFAQPKTGGRAELVDGSFVIRAAGQLGSNSGSLSASATEAAKVLVAQHETKTPRAVAMRVHQARGRIVLDLAQHENTRCVVVTREGWTVEDSPPDDVIFMGSGLPLPDPERGGSVEELRELLLWGEDDPRWPLVKGWLSAVLLANVPRPLLTFIGGPGATKTSTGRFVVGVYDPRPRGTLGSSFGKSRSDDETKALKTYLPAWDNLSSMSGEAADFISRMVTGDYSERRKLYTDADIVRIAYRRTGVLTGITIPTGTKADTLDRLVLIPLEKPTHQTPEAELEEKWETAHPRILAGALDLAARVVAQQGEGQNPHNLRMADYAAALWSVDPELERAYASNVTESRAEMAEGDPFIKTLLTWLGKEAKDGLWTGTPTEAFSAASRHHDGDFTGGWWPTASNAFTNTLTRQTEVLRTVGVRVETRKSNGERRIVFHHTKPEHDNTEKKEDQ